VLRLYDEHSRYSIAFLETQVEGKINVPTVVPLVRFGVTRPLAGVLSLRSVQAVRFPGERIFLASQARERTT
jgi:hypothetical protein